MSIQIKIKSDECNFSISFTQSAEAKTTATVALLHLVDNFGPYIAEIKKGDQDPILTTLSKKSEGNELLFEPRNAAF